MLKEKICKFYYGRPWGVNIFELRLGDVDRNRSVLGWKVGQ